jgi:hypothetical protein
MSEMMAVFTKMLRSLRLGDAIMVAGCSNSSSQHESIPAWLCHEEHIVVDVIVVRRKWRELSPKLDIGFEAAGLELRRPPS